MSMYPQPIAPIPAETQRLAWKVNPKGTLIIVFEYLEGLTDRQAAEAVRNRIDWKYALSQELDDAGWDASVLSEFRQRLTEHDQAALLLEKLVQTGLQEGWIRSTSKVRTDSTHILAKVRRLNQLEVVGETLRGWVAQGTRRGWAIARI